MTDGQRLGLIIDGIDIFKKWGVNIKSRDLQEPNKKKALRSVAHSSKVRDFSELYGGATYEERKLVYVVNIIGTNGDRISTQFLITQFTNFIRSKAQFKLVDESLPGYYFLAEARSGISFAPILTAGEATMTLDAYPFRIKEAREGSRYWNDYSILDYYQPTSFYTKRTTFTPLGVGALVTVGAWSTQYDGFESIPRRLLGTTYKITEVKPTAQSDSAYSYYLEGLNKWVIEQDIVQAQDGKIIVNVKNTGSNSVSPKIITDKAITIIRGNEIYNLWAGTTQHELLQLNEGDNYLTIAGYNANVDIHFHKELI